jgi:hypothetical protein
MSVQPADETRTAVTKREREMADEIVRREKRWKAAMAEKDAELDRLRAENARLRSQISGSQN